MKILQVHLSRFGGGARVVIETLAAALLKRGYEVINAFSSIEAEHYLHTPGVIVFMHGFERNKGQEYQRIYDIIRRNKIPRLFLMHDYWPICRQTNLLIVNKGNIQCSGTECIQEQCINNYDKFFWPTIDKNEHIICFCERSAAYFQKNGYCPTIIYHGIDLNRFVPSERERQHNLRICFSEFWGENPIKGFYHWKWIKNNLKEHNITIYEATGQIPHENMPNFYQQNDIMLFLSLWEETFGLVVAEAMACGLIVISYNTGIASSVIKNGENGFIVETNPRSILKTIQEIISMNNNKLKSISSNARKTAEEFFNIDKNINQYIELCQKIAIS